MIGNDILKAPGVRYETEEEDGLVSNLFVLTSQRRPAIPDVPTIVEFGAKVPKELEAAATYVTDTGLALALPPEVPQDRVEYLRNVMQRLKGNKDLQKEIEKLTGAWRGIEPGKDLQERMIAVKANKRLAEQLDALVLKYAAVQ